ncbi:hypothetical protein [uncultured Chitinophaga sp.]|uniref:hypothetical protein n=1 Tax=uncultured Chitinophaga sp. TaxID=339340 RepID=UPI0025D4D436|nr:hypothetical protein [uncultured Chitinophaga sp.]
MKNILIAASVLGAAAAGIVLYMRNRDRVDTAIAEVKDNAKNAFRKMNKHYRKTEKNAQNVMQHAMS